MKTDSNKPAVGRLQVMNQSLGFVRNNPWVRQDKARAAAPPPPPLDQNDNCLIGVTRASDNSSEPSVCSLSLPSTASTSPRELAYGPGIVSRLRDRFQRLSTGAASAKKRSASVDSLLLPAPPPEKRAAFDDDDATGRRLSQPSVDFNGRLSQVSREHSKSESDLIDDDDDQSDAFIPNGCSAGCQTAIPRQESEISARGDADDDKDASCFILSMHSTVTATAERFPLPRKPIAKFESVSSRRRVAAAVPITSKADAAEPPDEPEFVAMARRLRRVSLPANERASPPPHTLGMTVASHSLAAPPPPLARPPAESSPPPDEPTPPSDGGDDDDDDDVSTLSDDEPTSYDFAAVVDGIASYQRSGSVTVSISSADGTDSLVCVKEESGRVGDVEYAGESVVVSSQPCVLAPTTHAPDHRVGGDPYPVEIETLDRQSSLVAVAGDGNPVRHSLLSLVAEEDVPMLLEAFNEPAVVYDFHFERVVASNGGILATGSKADRGVVAFSTQPPPAYAYLEEAAAERAGVWEDGFVLTNVEYAKVSQAIHDEYLRRQAAEANDACNDDSDVCDSLRFGKPTLSGDGLLNYIPNSLEGCQFDLLGVTNSWSYGEKTPPKPPAQNGHVSSFLLASNHNSPSAERYRPDMLF